MFRAAPLVLVIVLCCAQSVHAQDEEPRPLAGERAARAAEVLEGLADARRDVDVLRADYVQTRRSVLLAEPLTSRGVFLLRREPATVVFRQSEPREAIIRLDERTYQVHRPAAGRAERFRFGETALFAAVLRAFRGDFAGAARPHDGGGDDGDDDPFAITDLAEADGTARITLTPRAERIRKRVRALELHVRLRDHALVGVDYVDGAGARVELRFTAIDRRPESVADDAFSADLPDDVHLLEHDLDD